MLHDILLFDHLPPGQYCEYKDTISLWNKRAPQDPGLGHLSAHPGIHGFFEAGIRDLSDLLF